jgi:predicted  nucleic acid-binding Zn-ribbon protein
MNIINKALEDRNTKLKEVSSKITECNTQIKNKEDQVKVLEEEFKHTFDINITGKVNGINAEIKELESTVETLRKAFDYTLRVKPDNDVVLDLNKKCDELSLEALRDNIIKSQEDYLNCLKEYSQKTSELTTIRTEIVRAEKNIDPDIIKIIDEWFKKKSSELYLHSKVISYECSGEEQGLVLNIRHNIERLAGSNDPFKFE